MQTILDMLSTDEEVDINRSVCNVVIGWNSVWSPSVEELFYALRDYW